MMIKWLPAAFLLQNCLESFPNALFCFKDTVELREHNWVPRKAFLDNGPKTINQIRQDAVKVSVPCKVQSLARCFALGSSSHSVTVGLEPDGLL